MNEVKSEKSKSGPSFGRHIRKGTYPPRFPCGGWIHPCFFCNSPTARVTDEGDTKLYACKDCRPGDFGLRQKIKSLYPRHLHRTRVVDHPLSIKDLKIFGNI